MATIERPAATTTTRTIAELWRRAAEEHRPGAAYLVERDDGAWGEVSWADAARAVQEIANGLVALGVRKGDAFGIFGRNAVEWALFDFALGSIGAICAPVYANSSAADAAYVLEHSESVGVLCEDDEQRAKVEGLGLAHVFTYADVPALRERGRAFAAESPAALAAAAAAVEDDDLFTYIYTS